MAEPAKKAAPKRKAAAKRKPQARKTAAKPKAPTKRKAPAKRKSAVRSNVRSVENKAAAVERKLRRTARDAEAQLDAAERATEKFIDRAQDAAHNAVLVTLGFYGKAFDQAQEQFESLQGRVETRRKEADKLYKELVKRGQKVEKDAKSAMDDFELPKLELDGLTDRKKIEARLEKARARFAELKESVGFKTAA